MGRAALHTILGVPNNEARQLYISYLRSDVLATLINELDHRLYGPQPAKDRQRRGLYLEMRHDAITELRGRQLQLFAEPSGP